MTHDYAGCELEPCLRCQDHDAGWVGGKTKAYDELLALATGTAHPRACGCRPCGVIREIQRHLRAVDGNALPYGGGK